MIASKFASTVTRVAQTSARSFSNTTNASAKVAVLGAAGGIGQPLSMLCKLSPEIDELSCYDVVGTPGVAADLSHVSVLRRHCVRCEL
jgi:malate dehydrogenase